MARAPSPRLVAALGEAFVTEPAGELTRKGVARPVKVARLVGERG